jgi:hypothetical protein
MYTLDRQDSSQQASRARSQWFFTILSVIALVCVSCNNAVQQTSQPRGRTVQSPRVTVAAGLPLTDSAPPQADMTPTVLVSTPQSMQLATTPIATPGISYEAESSVNTLAGGAAVSNCSGCSGRAKVVSLGLHDGSDGTLQFNNVSEQRTSSYLFTIYYLNADSNRGLSMSLNGGSVIALTAFGTGNRTTIATLTVAVPLSAGNNTIEFFNPSDSAPDIDRIVV